MKKITLLFAFLTLLTWQANSQIAIGTGALQSRSLPIEPVYEYYYTQVLYLAQEIGASGNITSIKYFTNSNTTLTNSGDWDVYLGHTLQSTFTSGNAWVPLSNLTQVYSGSVTVSGGEVTITFTTPFAYNGTSNLVVAIDENSPGNDPNNHDFICSSTVDERALRTMNGNGNFNPATPPTGWNVKYIANIELFGLAITCPVPTTLSAGSLTGTSADLAWIENGTATTWEIEWGNTGFSLGTGNPVTAFTNPTYNLTGLTPVTTYEYYVRSQCGVADYSPWAGPYSFTTPCAIEVAPWTDNIELHPWSTSFSSSQCWTDISSSYDWNVSVTGTTPSGSTGPNIANSGSNFFYVESNYGNTGSVAELTSPEIDLSAITNTSLEFYYHMYGANMGDLYVDVYNGSWNNNEASILGEQQTTMTDLWLKKTVDLSSFSGTIKIRFRAIAKSLSSTTGDISLDDISINGSSTVGIENSTKENINLLLYPNPTDGVFTLRVDSPDLSELKIKVTNLQGQIVYTKNNFDDLSKINEQIDLKNNPQGIYFITIISDKSITTQKIVIQ